MSDHMKINCTKCSTIVIPQAKLIRGIKSGSIDGYKIGPARVAPYPKARSTEFPRQLAFHVDREETQQMDPTIVGKVCDGSTLPGISRKID